jgi:HAD superfamily hydrolase (TIGR01490 family)
MTAPVFAFFDVDDTLIAVKSMFSFQNYWYAQTGDTVEQQRFTADMQRMKAEGEDWAAMNTRYYAYFAGRVVADVFAAGRAWFAALEQAQGGVFNDVIVDQLQHLRAQGVEPVFVSGSFPAIMAPVAARLGVVHMLVTRMEEQAGVFTGRILPPQTIGPGKARAVEAFLAEQGGAAPRCYAFGDDISDLPLLLAVGHPHAVAGGRGLEAEARRRGWPVLAPRARAA